MRRRDSNRARNLGITFQRRVVPGGPPEAPRCLSLISFIAAGAANARRLLFSRRRYRSGRFPLQSNPPGYRPGPHPLTDAGPRFHLSMRHRDTNCARNPGTILTSLKLYHSEPSTSPPERVTAAHQVGPLMLGERVRTLPSARHTSMPPAWAVAGRVGSQLPGGGCTWKIDPGPWRLPK